MFINRDRIFLILFLFSIQATSEEAVESNQDESLELYRVALQKAIAQHVSSKYVSDASSGSVYARDGKVTIVLTGEKVNLKNFWSGKWTSTWALQIQGNKAILAGEIKVGIHICVVGYFAEISFSFR